MLQAKNKTLIFSIFILSLPILQGCPAAAPPANVTTNTNSAANTVSSNTNSTNNSNTAATTTSAVIETKEPEQYQAVVKLKFETSGEQKLTLPGELQANVAKNGQNRRMEFNMPNGEKLIYLDANEKHLLILPNRKQFAELNKDSVGFDVRSMMTPEQIVNQVKNMKGVQRVGEEKYGDRDAVKYQYDSVTNTKSQAGSVETKSFIYVDKETGLPLHSETTAASQNGGYQGIQGLRIVVDMTDIKTTVDQSVFAEPADYTKVQPEQVKQQVDTAFNVITQLLQQLIKTAVPQQQPATNTNSNTAPKQLPPD